MFEDLVPFPFRTRSKGIWSNVENQNEPDTNQNKIDFSKLKTYNWKKSEKATSLGLPSVAPDRFYRVTYGTRTEEATSLKVEPITLPLKGTRNKFGAEPDCCGAAQSISLVKGSRNDRLNQASDVKQPFLQVQTCRKPNGDKFLYSQVKTSIEKLDTKHGHVMERPLTRERGRYRPSRPYTCPAGTKSLVGEVLAKDKDYSSADVFMEILVNSKQVTKRKSMSGIPCSVSRPSTCLSGLHAGNHIQGMLIQNVIDCNRPHELVEAADQTL